jgi:nucleoside-diphosphate-sugar epimerase
MRVLIIGCGYVGLSLGRKLVSGGYKVDGLRRSSDADDEMRDAGITPVHADITATLASLQTNYDYVVNLASSTRGGVDEYRSVYLSGTTRILEWLQNHPPKRYIYTSSTSVYAQHDGSWVTEENSANPGSETSKILRATEDVILNQNHIPSIILRTSGIYGPGRGHLYKQFLKGEALLREDGENYINMVHVDDVAGAIHRCFDSGSTGIYNLTDDEPVTQRAFFSWLAAKLNKPFPPSAPADPKRKRGLTDKRVSNAKLKSQTDYVFKYPTFREGYSSGI